MSDAVIIRRKVASNFTVLDNAIIRDMRLSWKALGLLVRLLSLPPNFKLRLVSLSRERPSGRDATRSGLKDLEQCGYLTIVREREASGKFTTTTWIVNDRPEDTPKSEKPNVVDPKAVNATSENPTLVSTAFKEELSVKTTTTTTLADHAAHTVGFREAAGISVPLALKDVLPVINHLPIQVQQDIIDEIEGKRRRGALRSNPIGLARHFAASPEALVLSDGLDVRRDRERARQAESVKQMEQKAQNAENQKIAAGLAQMSSEDFEALCSKLPPRIRDRITQQRIKAAEEKIIEQKPAATRPA